MANGKKSFLIYCDIIHNIDHLTNEEKGILFQHLLEYVNDMNPELTDRVLLSAWKPIQNQLKKDLKSWEDTKNEKSNAGRLGNLKRWHKDLYRLVVNNNLNIEDAEEVAKCRKPSHSDKNIANIAVNVNDNVSVNVNDIIVVYDKFVAEVKNGEHTQAIDEMYMRLKIKKGSLTPLLKEFRGQLIIDQKKHKDTLELRKHFNNWLNTQERVGKLKQHKIVKTL